MTRDVLIVGVYGLITALATGLGALPFVLVRRVDERAAALANSIAAGLMLGACFGLVDEGIGYGRSQTIAGAVAGVGFILATQRWLAGHDVGIEGLRDARGRKMILLIVVMTLHSFAEGVAVGASFGGGVILGAIITTAIAVHNIPEGLAISAVLRGQGVGVWRCAGWSIFSSLPQPLMAMPAFLFVDRVRPALPYALGFAAGAMMFMVFEELLPEAYARAPKPVIGLVTSVTFVAMVLFQAYLG